MRGVCVCVCVCVCVYVRVCVHLYRLATASPSLCLRPGRGDSLERLWSSVEVYCRDITESDLQQLQEYMTKDSKLFDVPPLGVHYARQWAMGDLEAEQEATLSGTADGSKEGGFSWSSVCSGTAGLPLPSPSLYLLLRVCLFRPTVPQARQATQATLLGPAGPAHAAPHSGRPAPTTQAEPCDCPHRCPM